MKFLWNLAKKNLSRSRIRTSISAIAIAVAIIAVVFARGLISGMIESTFENHIHYKAGHIRIIDEEYKLKERLLSLNYSLDGFNGKGYSEMIEKLKSVEGVKQVIPRLKFGAGVSRDDELVGMMGWGIDPAEEIAFTRIDEKIIEGRMVEPGSREVVIGAGLLEKIDREVGDKVTILYTTPFGSFKGSTFQIVGKLQSALQILDDTIFYLPLDQAQRILEMPGEVTELLLITSNQYKAASILPGLNELFSREDESGKKDRRQEGADQGGHQSDLLGLRPRRNQHADAQGCINKNDDEKNQQPDAAITGDIKNQHRKSQGRQRYEKGDGNIGRHFAKDDFV